MVFLYEEGTKPMKQQLWNEGFFVSSRSDLGGQA